MDKISTYSEHILVCLSSSPSNPKVIKTAARMAQVFDAAFTALYIETSRQMTPENFKRLNGNTALAKELGAKIVTINGDDIAYQVSQYARAGKVTKIVIGRAGYKANSLFSPPNFIDKLIELNPDTEIYVIPDKVQKLYISHEHKIKKISLYEIGKIFLILLAATGINLTIFNISQNLPNITLIYVLAILLISYITTSRLCSIIASFITILIFDFLFVEPLYTFTINNPATCLTCLMLFCISFGASSTAKYVKEQIRLSSIKAYGTEIMLEMSQELQQCKNEKDITNVTLSQIQKLLNCEDISIYSNAEDEAVKQVFEKNKTNGNFYPISNSNKVFAVIEIRKTDISQFEKNLLSAMLRESALAYEKEEFSASQNELILKNKQEELRSTLLRAISHDLRTPLTSISGYADLLLRNGSRITDSKKEDFIKYIYDDAVWLLNIVENILSITRFDKNKIAINMESEFISDVIMEAVAHIGREKENFNIETVIEDDTLSAKMDAKLVAQVIFNLINNAMKYSPCGTTIIIRARADGSDINVSVEDQGNGISDEDKKRIFEMFYTTKNSVSDGRRGLGLGLALCKSVIEAHGGTITVKDNKPSGTIFSFRLRGDFYEQ